MINSKIPYNKKYNNTNANKYYQSPRWTTISWSVWEGGSVYRRHCYYSCKYTNQHGDSFELEDRVMVYERIRKANSRKTQIYGLISLETIVLVLRVIQKQWKKVVSICDSGIKIQLHNP